MALKEPATNINEPKLINSTININDMIDDVPYELEYELEIINQDENNSVFADALMSDTVHIIDLNNTNELLHERNDSLVRSEDNVHHQKNTENEKLYVEVITDTRITEKEKQKKGNSALRDKNVNKRKRMMGNEYIGYTRRDD
ncbi:unnamed protein product [Psylliodes chrysocephalus]|uniref:Uncharacterized protein n=1 Tax=Psylliodes chrysocephalus TaxID=3402493 RepID=A0A9P0CDH2_9CUCU|nr:unnamed protein product [Psylliodes chrysocephala]